MLRAAPDEGLDDQEWKAFLNEQDFGQAIPLGIGRRYPLPRPERALLLSFLALVIGSRVHVELES